MAKKPVRVLVVDADPSVAARLEALTQTAGLALVGCASTGDEALDLAVSESPDVAFVALDVPGAAAATRRILGLTPSPPRVVLMSAEPGPTGGGSEPADVSGYVASTDDSLDVAGVVAALSPLTARASR